MGAPVAKSGAWRPGLASRLRRRVLGPNLRAVGGERGDAGGALDGVVARLRQITVPPLPPPLRRLGTGRRAPADTEREAEEEDLGAVPWHGADEGHFVAAGGGWELALRRFRPAAGAAEADAPPVLLLPGCATNASTFDLAPRVSLARHLARQGLDTWAVELRGIGSSRREGGMSASPPADRWDFDTHLQEDLRAVARFVGECTGAPELSGVGHSMGGMLLLCAAARGSREAGVPPFTRVVTLASCLECPSGESSYGSVAGLRERYPGTAEAVQSKLGATPIPVDGISVVQSMAMGAASGQYASWRKRNPDAAGEAPHRNYTTLAGMLSGSTSAVGSTPAPLLRRLLRNSFEDVPLSLVIQMASLFADGGLRSRDGTPYLDSVRAWEKPRVMCIAANKDGVFSTAAVAATAAAARARYVEVGGKRSGTRNDYNHYDVLVGSQAPDDVFPVISEFLLSSAEQTDADQHHVGASQQSTPRRPPPRPQTAMARQADDPPGETAAQALAASLWQEEDGERADVSEEEALRVAREAVRRLGASDALLSALDASPPEERPGVHSGFEEELADLERTRDALDQRCAALGADLEEAMLKARSAGWDPGVESEGERRGAGEETGEHGAAGAGAEAGGYRDVLDELDAANRRLEMLHMSQMQLAVSALDVQKMMLLMKQRQPFAEPPAGLLDDRAEGAAEGSAPTTTAGDGAPGE